VRVKLSAHKIAMIVVLAFINIQPLNSRGARVGNSQAAKCTVAIRKTAARQPC